MEALVCPTHGLMPWLFTDRQCRWCGEELALFSSRMDAALFIDATDSRPPMVGASADREIVRTYLGRLLAENRARLEVNGPPAVRQRAAARQELLLEIYLPLVGSKSRANRA
jgi:hypothetical protein